MTTHNLLYKSNNYDNATVPCEIHKKEPSSQMHLLDLCEYTSYKDAANWSSRNLEFDPLF